MDAKKTYYNQKNVIPACFKRESSDFNNKAAGSPLEACEDDGFMFKCFTPDLAFDFICVHLRCYRSFAFSFACKSFDFKVLQQDVSRPLLLIFELGSI